MSLVYDPSMTTVFDRVVDNLFDSKPRAQSFMPPVDAQRTDEAILVSLDLPGMTKSDITVRFQEGVLEISGHRESRSGDHYIQQRWEGDFQRRIRIKEPIDGAAITATYEAGILLVTLPHRAPPDTVRIEVA